VIEVVGLTARGWSDLPERLRTTIQEADVLLGSPRHFDLIPSVSPQQRLPWPSPLREGLPRLLSEVAGRRVVALASGDPLLAGIGGTLVEMLGTDAVRIHPAVSSAALARARMGWSEESTRMVRLRGGDLDIVRRTFFPAPLDHLVARRDSPAEVAQLLADAGYGDSVITVLGDLDTEAESRIDMSAREIQRRSARAQCGVCGLRRHGARRFTDARPARRRF
jgi:precorrin-6Y C5,15-methyltransferase (decarboxylating)